jgi:hypothetical protein
MADKAFDDLMGRADKVIASSGLGPAPDTRAKQALGGKKAAPKAAPAGPSKMTVERSDNDKFITTHHYDDKPEPEVHAVEPSDLWSHVTNTFKIGDEGAAIKAKKQAVDDYNKARPDDPLFPK